MKNELLRIINTSTGILMYKGEETLSNREVYNRYIEPLLEGNNIVFKTSGSTGEPKKISHDFEEFLERYSAQRKGYRTLITLDLSRIGGMDALLHTIFYGGVAVIPETKYPEDVLKLIEQHAVELLVTSPTMLRLMVLTGMDGYTLSSLKIISYGSERMSDALLQKLHEQLPEVKLKQTYGLTEFGVLRTHSEGNLIKILDRNYKVIDGILHLEKDGTWFNTGDMVEENEEYLKILGRKSSAIWVAGMKVSPEDVEEVLLSVCDDALVYGEGNDMLGNIVVADVISNKSKDEILLHCEQRLDKYKIPVKINFVEKIEYTENGKRKRK
jgi:acyl-coenzyme A synthetase/AMP-(fatty) acid ligase